MLINQSCEGLLSIWKKKGILVEYTFTLSHPIALMLALYHYLCTDLPTSFCFPLMEKEDKTAATFEVLSRFRRLYFYFPQMITKRYKGETLSARLFV